MNREWKDRMVKVPGYEEKLAYEKEARLSGCWIYSKATKNLYTPEEFMDSDENVSIRRGKQDINKFAVIDPRIIRQRMRLEAQKLVQDIEELDIRMAKYFNNKYNF